MRFFTTRLCYCNVLVLHAHYDTKKATCMCIIHKWKKLTPSTPTHVSTATGGGISDGDLVLIVAGGGGLFAICLSGLVVGVACCLICRQKRKEDKVKRVSSKHSSVDQFPLHKVRRSIHWLCDVPSAVHYCCGTSE